jgi:hypothetical protein
MKSLISAGAAWVLVFLTTEAQAGWRRCCCVQVGSPAAPATAKAEERKTYEPAYEPAPASESAPATVARRTSEPSRSLNRSEYLHRYQAYRWGMR